MKVYENDEQVVDELCNIMDYIHNKYKPHTYFAALGHELEEIIIKIREEIEA